jgi:hypothetical protein
MSGEIDRVSKLDAARRQLREAILLFFERRDPIAVHTLAAAAHQILHDLGQEKGGVSMLKDNPYIRSEKRGEVINILNAAQNFFKHADRDPDADFEFRPSATPLYIIDAVEMWGELSGSFFKEALIFRLWFLMAHPHLVASEEVNAFLEPFRQQLRQLGVDVNDFSGILKAIDIL